MPPKPAHSRLLMCALLGTLSLTARAAEPAPQRAVPLVTPVPTGVLLPYGAGYEQRLRATAADTPMQAPPSPEPQQADAQRGASGTGGHGGGGHGGGGRGGGRGH